MRIAFLASHNGSSMRYLVEAVKTGILSAEPVLLIASRADSSSLAYAAENGIPHVIVNARDHHPYASEDEAVCAHLQEARPDVVVLSGYMRKIGSKTLAAFEGRILNIHPALLPKFGGQGMYGIHVHQAVLASGERVTGATVHLVDAEYDHGQILAQATVPVLPNDTPQSLAERVKAQEGPLYLKVLTNWQR
ncbi:phosphoribosylglycinamide formyltransferase [Alicyclobacillus sp. TC]|uniref:Phosphoribosylglycinamide formyltransferase n=1 Tax=Alicyclobacillus tolerans TaxID=90970 RepID=A0ABT9LWF2_9BACL|nr:MULTISPECIES: phosphoribosylglycinamide formyltransferase [Alicyclobacillus]MDP9728595.1 phosphoribosylglycinamide formyltransferase-1 [Alicyclobacillus tengchongensis]QRF22590.1 phosphoribosylglycinamide formyltransferase [Alicyclobacillus sp. TC]